MRKKSREKMIKAASDKAVRKRSNFFERLFFAKGAVLPAAPEAQTILNSNSE